MREFMEPKYINRALRPHSRICLCAYCLQLLLRCGGTAESLGEKQEAECDTDITLHCSFGTLDFSDTLI